MTEVLHNEYNENEYETHDHVVGFCGNTNCQLCGGVPPQDAIYLYYAQGGYTGGGQGGWTGGGHGGEGDIFDENHRDALKVVAFLLQNYYINNIDGRGDYTFIDNNASTEQIIDWAKENLDANEWSDALVGYEGDYRPPFIIVEQELQECDGIIYERIVVSKEKLLEWYSRNKN